MIAIALKRFEKEVFLCLEPPVKRVEVSNLES